MPLRALARCLLSIDGVCALMMTNEPSRCPGVQRLHDLTDPYWRCPWSPCRVCYASPAAFVWALLALRSTASVLTWREVAAVGREFARDVPRRVLMRSISKNGGSEVEPKGSILLVYFVADESGSMARNIGELNEGLITLQDELQKQPFAAARVRFSVIGFSDTAFTHLEAADLRSTHWLPTLGAQGLTSYAAAFNELGLRISVDIPRLKQQGFAVLRPAVFFLTDGMPSPNDNWRAAQARLLAQPTRPNVIAFGIGNADAQVVCELATEEQYAFKAARGVDTGVALSEFLTSLTQSVISSGQAVASGHAELQFDRPEGFNLAVDFV